MAARPPTVSVFALPPTPPLLTLLRQPVAFYAALQALPPQPWRYLWLALLGGLLSGAASTLLSRPLIQAQTALSGVAALPPALNYGTGLLSGLFSAALVWLLLSWLGGLGARARGADVLDAPPARPAEVYGATLLLPLLWGLVSLLLAALFTPQLQLSAPLPRLPSDAGHAAQQLTLARQALALSRQYTALPVVRLVTWGGYLVLAGQLALAYLGLQTMTASRDRARRGVLVPLAVLLVLGLILWLANLGLGQLTAAQLSPSR
jgi:hypothetical protein